MYFPEDIKKEQKDIIKLNKKITKDIIITYENAIELISNKNNYLKILGRIDLTNDIIQNIILTFIDSPFIDKENYIEIFSSVIETFIYYESIFSKKLSSEEILIYLNNEFNKNEGNIELLNSISFERLCDKYVRKYWNYNKK